MKKIIITVFATSLISTTAFAAPAHKRAHQHERQHHSSTHAQVRSNHKLHRDLLGLALFVGAAVAIDAAIDNHHDREKRPARPYRPDAVGPTRHHDHYQANRHTNRHSKGRDNHNYDGRGHSHRASIKIDDRQQNQHRRIRQGVESGALAKGEAKRLRQEQRHIAQLEADFRADGRLNRKESAILLAKLKTSSDRIYNKKHNDRYRR